MGYGDLPDNLTCMALAIDLFVGTVIQTLPKHSCALQQQKYTIRVHALRVRARARVRVLGEGEGEGEGEGVG